jgi:hypothetical protein
VRMFTRLFTVTATTLSRGSNEQVSEALLEDFLLFLAGSVVGGLLVARVIVWGH